MIYFTGDTHGRFDRFDLMTFSPEDVIVILGDSGFNYYSGYRAEMYKKSMNKKGCKILCVHGNHEQRPETISSYHLKPFMGGQVYIEDKYPNLLFAYDGSVFDLDGRKMLVVGGAYSVDKYYRQVVGLRWWADEQPSEEIKRRVEQSVADHYASIDIIATHTCPHKYIPTEMFLPGIDQSRVDNSTEEWLGLLEKATQYRAWVCGHFHTNKIIDRLRFFYEDIVSLEELFQSIEGEEAA